MVDFPHGQCDDASGMLASYLEDCGFGSWELVVGHRPPKFHAWLERDGVILDITADQFDDEGHPPVVVTRDRAWHAQFDEVSRRRARPRLNEIEHTSTREGLMRFHEAVRGRLPDTPDVE